MRVTVCELPDERSTFEAAWEALVAYVKEQKSDLVLLPELPFSSWFATTPDFDATIWQRVQQEHDAMMKRLPELAPATVLSTHLLIEEGRHLNRGFVWTPEHGYTGVHDKYYFPDEDLFYERRWFDRSPQDFTPVRVRDMVIGFMICTEVMFTEWARHYGRQGVNILAVPRATPPHARWEVAPRMAAISSGAFVISSNHAGNQLFGGRGLIIDPDGEILAETSHQTPFVTAEIDLEVSAQAKKTYPRDVQE
ncbi:N-carbamoylputrescine amidase [Thermosporothrix hazakensis]|jgi:N-carbamoylputrescine amidase|uniref:N-carbamoylputrescine amidase n=1 Tax=Thermosporothrix hazakensis TaxID=644383 RepID=A0A326UMS7_THEHA|nr:N-carbamoylputrescine amidase [Thermosporothrix hazakensis]GCE50903.1 N-carbamoyl-D-amino-acid hydrolase [Thermosporothrix hazakensis]